MMGRQEAHLYEFGTFRLDTAERRLLRGDEVVPLKAKVFDLLLLLVERQGHLLTKDELMRVVWQDAFVEEANLAVSVSALRKALGEGRAEHQYIETVPRYGYRFVASVQEVGDASRRQAASSLAATSLTAEAESGVRAQVIDSLAVLPFVNLSADPDAEYLSDGITESIINNLSQLPNLRVMARSTVFRYKGREVDPQEVGRDLNVSAVLTGRVEQRGDHFITDVELVDAADGSRLWGESYRRRSSDIFEVQEVVATQVADKLRVRLTGEERARLTERHTGNTEAFHLYLKGLYRSTNCTSKESRFMSRRMPQRNSTQILVKRSRRLHGSKRLMRSAAYTSPISKLIGPSTASAQTRDL